MGWAKGELADLFTQKPAWYIQKPADPISCLSGVVSNMLPRGL